MNTVNYFAYGSNMLFARLVARCPSIVSLGTARLANHRLSFTKPGGDQSGKCGIVQTGDDDYVLGVLYGMNLEDKEILDRIEGVGHGYEDRDITVVAEGGPTAGDTLARVACFTYYPTRTDHDLLPFDWYKNFVVEGARENSFPETYLEKLMAVEDRLDPDSERRHSNLSILTAPSISGYTG